VRVMRCDATVPLGAGPALHRPTLLRPRRAPFCFLPYVIYCIHSPVGIFNIH